MKRIVILFIALLAAGALHAQNTGRQVVDSLVYRPAATVDSSLTRVSALISPPSSDLASIGYDFGAVHF